jgi:hypothetical protein
MGSGILDGTKRVWGKEMSEQRVRKRVVAEITLSYLIRLANEKGCPVTREQALAFLNQQGRAFEMWKHMMQAAKEFIAGNLLQGSLKLGEQKRIAWSAEAAPMSCVTTNCLSVAAESRPY